MILDITAIRDYQNFDNYFGFGIDEKNIELNVDKVLFEYNKAKTVAEQFKAQEEGLQNMLIEAQKKIKETASPVEKKKLELPLEVKNVIKCKNPRCITSTEQDIQHIFKLTNAEKGEYRCMYCRPQQEWMPFLVREAHRALQ